MARATAVTPEMQKWAVAWAKDKIKTVDLQYHLKCKDISHCLYRAAVALREAVRAGMLK